MQVLTVVGWQLHKIPKYGLLYLSENMLYKEPAGDTLLCV